MNLPNTKPRFDGKGDPWANSHRTELPSKYLMTDIDGLFGYLNFYKESQESLFLEYEINRHTSTVHQEEFAIVAILDRKSSKETALSQGNRLSRNFYCWLARAFAKEQVVEPLFFYICGTRPPWLTVEINIHTGQPIVERYLIDGKWKDFYRDSGLDRIRAILQQSFNQSTVMRHSCPDQPEERGNPPLRKNIQPPITRG